MNVELTFRNGQTGSYPVDHGMILVAFAPARVSEAGEIVEQQREAWSVSLADVVAVTVTDGHAEPAEVDPEAEYALPATGWPS